MIRTIAVGAVAGLALVACGGDPKPRGAPPPSATPSHAIAPTARAGVAAPPVRNAVPPAQAAQSEAAAWPAHARITRRTPVPILMYHVIGDPPAGAPYPRLFVGRAEFASQMRALDRAGYEAITLDELYNAWHGGPRPPRRPVVISFDDGYAGWYPAALETLRTYGWRGVLNLKVEAIGQKLSTRRVRRFIAAGWEIDAHTVTHADLPGLDDAQLEREIAGSRRLLRKRFGVPVNFFCYPAGRYDVRVIAAVRAAGFRGATTTEPGLARSDRPFTLARVRVDRGDGATGLLTKLRGHDA